MRPIVPRPCMLLVPLAAGGLLVACGTTSHPSATSAQVATATTGPTGSDRQITSAQAKAFARAVNLTAADVPGFAVSPRRREHETAAEKRLEHEMLRCTGGAGFNHGLAEGSSEEFERKGAAVAQGVSSNVTVVKTSALAAKELKAIRSSHVRACFTHYLGLLFKAQRNEGFTIGRISIASGTPPAPGTSGGFGWRISTAIAGHGIAIPFSMDILGFVYGPAEVALLTYGFPRPFPAAIEQRLFSLLVKRAKARGL